MTYIYDTPLDINTVTLERYGVTFKLEQTFKMGARKFASFTAPGMDKILIVPQFANQYQKLGDKLKRLSKKKTFKDLVDYVEKYIDPNPTLDEEPDEEDDTIMKQTIVCQFKDIKVKLEYYNNEIHLNPEFEIVQNNLFGNGIVVDTRAESEE